MPDLKAKLRARFTRRQSGPVGDLAKENSSAAASFASSIASAERSSLVSRSGSTSQQSQHPPTATANADATAGLNTAEHETNHSAHAYFNDVKSGSKLEQHPATHNKPNTWNVGEQDDDADRLTRKLSATSTTDGKTATGPGKIIPTPGEEPATEVSATDTIIPANKVQSKIQASDMNSNDQRPPINRLPSINEQPGSELSETNGGADPAAIASANESTTIDDDDPLPLSTPLPMRETQTIATPKVVPATPDIDPNTLRPSPVSRPSGPPRQQSLLPHRQSTLIQTLLHTGQAEESGYYNAEQLLPIHNSMVTRKIWVRRPGSSATQVTIKEDDLVDDVRDMILQKYGNSLGRQFDSPDITLRIVPREKRQEHILGPEEHMCRVLDAYFPGGQLVNEALIIDVPQLRRTPRASPRTGPPHATHLTSVNYYDEARPTDSSTDYFGPNVVPGVHIPMTVTAPSTGSSHPHAISVLSTGQVPQIPSPGGTRSRNYRDRPDRPRLGRQHTSSPTIIGGHPVNLAAATVNHGMHGAHSRSHNVPRPRTHSNASDQSAGAAAPPAPPMPTPPAGDMPNSVPSMVPMQRSSTPPPPRTASPRPLVPQMSTEASGRPSRPRKKRTIDQGPSALPSGIVNNGVPPINVLIVEDNIINLKLLEAFVKRLKVRWQTAMNGRDAVTKWRTGGFHLVLMDIQLPIMSGLDATREIRRLERVNSIGVFSGSAASAFASSAGTTEDGAGGSEKRAEEEKREPTKPEDRLVNMEVFKSPVIIVALTASSLQSDRHEALAAGCNDFLTKPVNFVWLERKVMEWGCMQALIDFDGWRKWKDFSNQKAADEAAAAAAAEASGSSKKSGAGAKKKSAKSSNRLSMSSSTSAAASASTSAAAAATQVGA